MPRDNCIETIWLETLFLIQFGGIMPFDPCKFNKDTQTYRTPCPEVKMKDDKHEFDDEWINTDRKDEAAKSNNYWHFTLGMVLLVLIGFLSAAGYGLVCFQKAYLWCAVPPLILSMVTLYCLSKISLNERLIRCYYRRVFEERQAPK